MVLCGCLLIRFSGAFSGLIRVCSCPGGCGGQRAFLMSVSFHLPSVQNDPMPAAYFGVSCLEPFWSVPRIFLFSYSIIVNCLVP